MLVEEIKKEKLDEKSLAKLEGFISMIDDNSEYFTIADGQSKQVTFDLENSIGFQKRTIFLDDGSEKQINQFMFIVILKSGKTQIWNLAPRFSKQRSNSEPQLLFCRGFQL